MTDSVTAEELPTAWVELTENEARLVEMLTEAAKETGTTVRICGGWVRDKALGRVTKDIDVAVDNCSGAAFADRVKRLHERRGGSPASRVGVIAANPDQSKHLETATMRVCGLEVDFVNLRSEAYADASSRVPTSVDFGTPLQDALRRDFTVNALFFNAHTRRIEDHTGRGWSDLRAGILRTPLEARVTLLDDPLRALRGVRFAARYGFDLDPAFRAACADADVRDALLAKVSRERVGKETRGAFGASASGAVRALDELSKLGLAAATFRAVKAVAYLGPPDDAPSVFLDPGRAAQLDSEKRTPSSQVDALWLLATRCVAAHAAVEYADDPDGARFKRDDGAVVALALALAPLASATAVAPGNRPKKNAPLPVAVCRDGLKLPNSDVDKIHKLLRHAPRLLQLVDRFTLLGDSKAADPDFRKDVGNLLFDLKLLWPDLVAVARAVALAGGRPDADVRPSFEDQRTAHIPGLSFVLGAPSTSPADTTSPSPHKSPPINALWPDPDSPLVLDLDASQKIVRDFADFVDAVRDPDLLDLDSIWTRLVPFYDGNALPKVLTGLPPGPAVGCLLQAQRDFQLANPTADADAARVHLQARLEHLVQSGALPACRADAKKQRV